MKMECYYNKFSDNQCQNQAKWIGCNTGNFTDSWTWCDEHKPQDGFCKPLDEVDLEAAFGATSEES
jgi:hypothetical protein